MQLLTDHASHQISGGNIYFSINDKGARIAVETANEACLYNGFTFTTFGCIYDNKPVLDGQIINGFSVQMQPHYFGSYQSQTGVAFTIKAV